MPQSCLYDGEVMHWRKQPVQHRFTYRVFSLLLDIDKTDTLGLRLFAHNRFSLFSLHDRDHGERDGSPLRPWVERQLRAHDIDLNGGRVFLHAMPRLLGYVFNPLSVYWCYDSSGRLRALLCEVKNTFGEQHVYCLPVSPAHPVHEPVRQHAAKEFYVSPFIPMEAEYRFAIRAPEEALAIVIRETVAEGELLVATHTGTRRALSDGALLRAAFLFPLLTLKVVAAIHWQALRLWLKGAPLQPRPEKDDRRVPSL